MTTETNDEIRDLLSPHDADGREFLAKVSRTLINLKDGKISAKVVTFGLNDKEQKTGWSLLWAASGVERPLDHFVSTAEVTLSQANNTMKSTIDRLDEFENKWFDQCGLAINRYVDKSKRQAVYEGFYTDLRQVERGPEVVGSVAKLLSRLNDLEKSDAPGAKRAVDALAETGLTKDLRKEMADLVASAQGTMPQAAQPKVSENDQLAAAQKQVEAFEELKLWYAYWAEACRKRLKYHDLVKLGLRAVKGGRKASSEEDTGDVDVPAGTRTLVPG
ncbi:MAG: hypothetical protein AB2A00_37510 [Myxococcota bacterium]